MSGIVDQSQPNPSIDLKTNKYLTFILSGETYGISILHVREIIEYDQVTPIPMMPAFIRGAINVRGKIIPVVDLGLRLGKRYSNISKRSGIVIVELQLNAEQIDIGFIVDAVSRVTDIDANNIDKAPSFGGNIRTDFIYGFGKSTDSFVVLLHIEKILSMQDVKWLAHATKNPDIDIEQKDPAKTELNLES